MVSLEHFRQLESWIESAYSGGSTAAASVDKDTKVNTMFNTYAATDITTNTTNIAITKKGESASGNGLVLDSSADGNVFIGTLGDVTGDKLVNLSGDSVCDANLIFIDSATGISALHDLHAVDSSNTQVTLVRGTVGETAIGTDATATTTLRRVVGLATDGSLVVLDVGTGSNAPSSNTFRVLPDGGIGVGNKGDLTTIEVSRSFLRFLIP